MEDHGTRGAPREIAGEGARELGAHPFARFRKPFTFEQVIESPMVCFPLRLYEICPVSDGAAAAVICSASFAKRKTTKPVWVASSAVATARFDDGITRHLAAVSPSGATLHSEAKLAVETAFERAGLARAT